MSDKYQKKLTSLPNIGENLANELRKVGIYSTKRLIELGSVEATLKITRGRPSTGYNLLYALEGAIRGVRWHSLQRADLLRLRSEYDAKRLSI